MTGDANTCVIWIPKRVTVMKDTFYILMVELVNGNVSELSYSTHQHGVYIYNILNPFQFDDHFGAYQMNILIILTG